MAATVVKILVDDFRYNLPDGSLPDLIIRNFATAYKLLDYIEQPSTELYLDHDLGEEKTGYDLITIIEKDHHQASGSNWFGLLPAKIVCVSDNGSGRLRIQQVIDNLYKER